MLVSIYPLSLTHTHTHTHTQNINIENFSIRFLAFNIILSIRFQLLALTILINMNNNYTTFINIIHSLPSLSLTHTHTHTHREQYIQLL